MIVAVIPAKPFAEAKSRLIGPLDPEGRAAMARAMFERVVGLAAAVFDGVCVVTTGPAVAAIARACGAEVVPDPPLRGLAHVVDAGLAAAERAGATTAVVLMADLPLLDVDDLLALRAAAEAYPVVIAPDHKGCHTNALALTPPTRFATRFGHPQSLEMHVRQAQARVVFVRRRGLALDLDLPTDLAAVRRADDPRTGLIAGRAAHR